MSETVGPEPDAAEIAARVEQLVEDAREAGFSDEAILSETIEALKEGLS